MWKIHPRLLEDCHHLLTYQHVHILLRKIRAIPWLILVPETEQHELCDLADMQYAHVLSVMKRSSWYLRRRFAADKINVAEIGNLVPQLHIHVIARSQDDPLWPAVVWGQSLVGGDYSTEEIAALRGELTEWLLS